MVLAQLLEERGGVPVLAAVGERGGHQGSNSGVNLLGAPVRCLRPPDIHRLTGAKQADDGHGLGELDDPWCPTNRRQNFVRNSRKLGAWKRARCGQSGHQCGP